MTNMVQYFSITYVIFGRTGIVKAGHLELNIPLNLEGEKQIEEFRDFRYAPTGLSGLGMEAV
ncbi:MAG: hypothetical protein ABIN18_27615 [Pseudomonadota bacterium]